MMNLKDSSGGTRSTRVMAHVAVMILLPLVLSSCASMQLSHTWQDTSYVARSFKTILVIAVRKNQQTRQAWEDGFATELSKHGVEVTPSYRIFPDTLPDTAHMAAITRDRKFDGIILVGKISVEKIEGVTSRYDITSPAFSSRPWESVYSAYLDREYYPGYPVFATIVKDEIKVWSTQEGTRMIWSGVGEVEGSNVREEVRHAIIELIVPELVKLGVLAEGS